MNVIIKKRLYHLHIEDSTEHVNLSMTCKLFLNATRQEMDSTQSSYNLCADLDLGGDSEW
jgi:hypothetical protein